jgi:hypothetical protein
LRIDNDYCRVILINIHIHSPPLEYNFA